MADGFQALPGLGARGVVDGRRVVVGRERLLRDLGFAISAGLAGQWAQWERAGRTAVLVGWDDQLRGALAVGNTVEPSAPAAVAGLRGLGLRPVLLTGDNEATVRAVAAAVGIDEVIAGVLPADKAAAIKDLQARGTGWRWWATGSTTPPRWPRPTWAWPSARVPTWRSPRPT